jgi:hypothetical protein
MLLLLLLMMLLFVVVIVVIVVDSLPAVLLLLLFTDGLGKSTAVVHTSWQTPPTRAHSPLYQLLSIDPPAALRNKLEPPLIRC